MGIAPQTWAIIMIAVASVVGFLMALTRKDAAYLFVLVWSFVGIAITTSLCSQCGDYRLDWRRSAASFGSL